MLESSSLMQAQKDYPELARNSIKGGKIPDRASTMPLYWSSDDTRRAVIAALIPAGVGLVGAAALSQDRDFHQLLESARRPYWAPKQRAFYTTMDMLTLLPYGYASYGVYKYGGGFDYTDTSVALGLYGTSLALALGSIPLIKNKNLSGLAINSALIHTVAGAAAFAFWKIDNTSGYWALPFVAWTGFYSLLGYSVYQLNQHKTDL